MTTARVEVRPDSRRIARELADTADRAIDVTPVLRAGAQRLRTAVIDGFRNETDPWGSPWEPLEPETIERKGSSKILADTLALQRGVTFDVEDSSIVGGVSGAASVYGPTHQMGRDAIPARPFLPITEDDVDVSGPRFRRVVERIEKQLFDWILDKKRPR